MNSIFTDREFELINNAEILRSKRTAISKIEDLMSVVEKKINVCSEIQELKLNSKYQFQNSKISKGENYQGLPYVVLDHPKLFTKESTFSFRTMFWWGNSFSNTLHIAGLPLDHFRSRLIKRQAELREKHLYICINSDPWQYHYDANNYQLIDEMPEKDLNNLIRNHAFIKLSKKHELSEIDNLTKLSLINLSELFNIIS